MRLLAIVLCLLAAILSGAGIFQLSIGYFRSEEITKAAGRLSLYRSTVNAELERFSHLTYVLARDPFVISTASDGETDQLNARLRGFSQQAGLDEIYLMDADGVTISASNAGEQGSFVGQDYSFRPYFIAAKGGAQGRFYGIGATTGLPGYFIADPVRDAAGELLGVIAIKIDLSALQDSWRSSGEQVFLANADGVVLLSSDPAWRYRVLAPLSPDQRRAIEATRQFPGQQLEALAWMPMGDQRAEIGGNEQLHLITSDLPHDWALHYFSSDERAVALSWLVTSAAVFIFSLVLIFYQVLRTRRMGVALKRSVEEEAQLRRANERLAVEIEERRTAERRLKRAQNELERSSRLAALGQLSASVTHELGQPIAAMRNHLAAAEIGGMREGLTDRISALVERMEGITRQLKFFARTEADDFGDVDLREAMQAALALVEPNISAAAAQIDQDAPDHPVTIRGNRLRIEQVMTNLLRNALDAVEDGDRRRVQTVIGGDDYLCWFEIHDTGHGLGQAALSDLQEPFVSSRESGRGMGLGLAISAGIVTDHGGRMTAHNAEEGGAVFRVEFPGPGAENDNDREAEENEA